MAGTFSESWYRIARLHATLRAPVRCRKQFFRGEPWYFLHDPYNKNFYRLSPEYYRFVARLSLGKTIEDVWLETLREMPETAPGQQEILSLLIELHNENLIAFDVPPDTRNLFLRGDERRNRETTQRWMNLLFLRIPLWNPDRWLTRLLPLWRLLFSKAGALVGGVILALGLHAGIENAAEFTAEAGNVLAPGNVLMLYAGVAFVKLMHEIGHGALCKRFGCEVSAVGVMLLLFVPLPYIDATSSWELRDKWERILVSAGGMLMEFVIGALACLVWVHSPPGLVHGLAYNMMLTATVSTLLFNSNPLLKYDGYYILTDLIEIPNLYQKSRDQLFRCAERYLFGRQEIELPARTLGEGAWLLLYGLSSAFYRVALLIGILLFIADRYATLGMMLAVIMGCGWLLRPSWVFLRYLLTSPKLRGVRRRAIGVSAMLGTVPLLLVVAWPLDMQVVFPGIVQSTQHAEVLAETAGQVTQLFVQPGDRVRPGDALIQLVNPVLEQEINKAAAQLEQVEVLEQAALLEGGGDKQSLAKRKETCRKLLDDLLANRRQLTIVAQKNGVWIFPVPREVQGQWVSRGYQFGEIVDLEQLRFTAVVSQEMASLLFTQQPHGLVVRLVGQGEHTLATGAYSLIPHAHEVLPDQALSWMAGGMVPTNGGEGDRPRASEPFYLLRADLLPVEVPVMCGQTGQLRVTLAPESLATRGIRALKQFLQKRYQL